MAERYFKTIDEDKPFKFYTEGEFWQDVRNINWHFGFNLIEVNKSEYMKLKGNSVKEDMKIYRIDHFYSIHHNKDCLLIESNLNKEKMIKILGSIQFAFEDILNDDSICVNTTHILSILEEFYNVKNVKSKYKDYLENIEVEDGEWKLFNKLYIDELELEVIQIDLYNAREYFCYEGFNTDSIMRSVLPDNKKFVSKVLGYKEFYFKKF